MIELYIAVMFCVVQATLVAGVAWVLCGWLARRCPGGGATVVAAATIAVLTLTVAAFVPLPQSLRWPIEFRVRHVADARQPSVPSAAPGGQHLPEARCESGPSRGFVVDLTRLGSGKNAHEDSLLSLSPARSRNVWLGVPIVPGALAVVGFMSRQVLGLNAVRLLKKRSRPIADMRPHRAMRALQYAMGCGPAELRESSELPSAATVGWFRPAILLPADWRQWTDAELRAVVAHELAHVSRRDCPVRFLGCFCGAIHFYHPLVRWLLRRLVLEQEYAADRLAAQAAGGWRDYMCALSSFALRHSERPAVGACPAFLPVSSSFLMRRIEMLHTMDGSMDLTRPRRAGRLAVLVLLVVATAAVGLRNRASGADGETASPGAKVAAQAAESTPLNRPTPRNRAVKETAGADVRFDPTTMPLFEHGIFVIRVKSLLDRPDMRPFRQQLLESYAAGYKQIFGADKSVIGPRDVDFIAMVPLMSTGVDKKTGEEASRLEFRHMLVRFAHEDDWKTRIKGLLPGVVTEEHGSEGTYLHAPIPRKLGIGTLVVQFVDDRTVLLTDVPQALPVKKTKLSGKTSPWASHWRALEHDDIIFVCDTGAIVRTGTPEEGKLSPSKRAERRLAKHARYYALGLSWNKNSVDQLQIAARVTPNESGSMAEIRSSVETLLNLGKDQLLSTAKDETDKALARHLFDCVVVRTVDEGATAPYLDIQTHAKYSLSQWWVRTKGEKPTQR